MTDLYKHTEARRQDVGLLLYYLQSMASHVGDLIFPPRCAGCNRVDFIWCPRCQQELEAIPIEQHKRVVEGVPVVSSGEHINKLQRAVQALKYEKVTQLSVALGKRLAHLMEQLAWFVDIIIPIPMHHTRLRERGYNQAQLIAEQTAHYLSIPCLPDAIQRHRETRSQVGLNREERLENVADAFIADATALSNKNVLIIDDVCTTGATLATTALVARNAGAQNIYGLTVTAAHVSSMPNVYF